METTTKILIASILIIAAVQDSRNGRIANRLTLPAVLLAFTLHGWQDGGEGLWFSFVGFVSGLGLLIVFYLMGGIGAGDVKLMGAVGAFLGAKATFDAFLLIAIAGGVYSLALILIRRDVFKGFFSEKLMVLSSMVMMRQYVPIQTGSSGQKPRLKYGVAIAFGTIAYLFMQSFGIKFFA